MQGNIRKTAAQAVVLVDRHGRREYVKSLVMAAMRLASIGAIPLDDVRGMLSSRKPLINGVRVFYT